MAQNREPKSEQEILQSFQTQRNELRSLAAKIEELSADANEHGLVLKTLEPMEKDRKCFRLIGGVLVERTVADVAPSVKTNKDQLDLVCPLESKSPTGVCCIKAIFSSGPKVTQICLFAACLKIAQST